MTYKKKMIFIKIILFILFIIFSFNLSAGCDDPPANEVDWTNCNFMETS